jgi:uncharacterized membrane protein
MANYIIIGGDQKEYGPITENDIRQWITEGRINAQTMAKGDGAAEWRALAAFPEFSDLFATHVPGTIAPPTVMAPADWAERDYDLDIGGCISRGWELFKNNMGLLVGAFLVYFLIEGAIAAVGYIPLIGPLFSLANLVIAGPLMGGLYWVFIQTVRGRPAQVGDVFCGFRRCFSQLFLGHLVPALLAGLCLVPVAVVFAITMLPTILHSMSNSQGSSTSPAFTLAAGAMLIGVTLICLVPLFYLTTCWAFTLPLIIDKDMDFWTAMKTSYKMVKKHWWQVFALILLVGLINVAGVCLCCVGIIFTAPIAFATLMIGYENIFSASQAR